MHKPNLVPCMKEPNHSSLKIMVHFRRECYPYKSANDNPNRFPKNTSLRKACSPTPVCAIKDNKLPLNTRMCPSLIQTLIRLNLSLIPIHILFRYSSVSFFNSNTLPCQSFFDIDTYILLILVHFILLFKHMSMLIFFYTHMYLLSTLVQVVL